MIPGDGYQIMGVIVSRSFEGMDQAHRQGLVWDQVHKTLDEAEQARVEFNYTDAPSEVAS